MGVKHLYKSFAAVLWVMSGNYAFADWTGSGQVGVVHAHGNTDSTTANAKIDATDQLEMWKHTFGLNALYSESDEVTSGNRWDTAWQSDYNLTEKVFWFGGLRYEEDKYGAFSYQATATTGFGYKFFDTDTTKLSTQAGVGYKRSRPQTLIEDPDTHEVTSREEGDVSNRGVITGGINFEHVLTPNTKVLDKFLVEAASDNTFMQNNLSLQVSMTDRLALSVGYELRQNTSPPAGQYRLDSLTTLNLVYKVQ
jgi:putative salt-induced outer membrane protein